MHSPTPEPAKAGFSRSRGVSVYEKEQQFMAAGLEWPRCDCHGVPMRWKKREAPAGGSWHCRQRIRDKTNAWKWENIDHVRREDNRREAERRQNPEYLLKKIQYHSLYKARRAVIKATNRAEEMYA